MRLNKTILFILVIMISAMGLFAGEVSFSNDQLSFRTSSFELSETTINGETFTTIKTEAGVTSNDKGFAALPYYHASVRLENKNVNLDISTDSYEEYQLEYPLLPARGTIYRDVDPSTVPYEIADESIVDEFYPNDVATATEPYIIRDVRGTNVYFHPFQYNAATQTLRVYNTINARIIENDSAVINPLPASRATKTKVMDNLYRTVFINYTTDRFDNELDEFGSILVITTAEYAEAIAPYVQWKREKGHTVYVEETSGNVTSLVEEQYNAHNDILYVQLVGDWDDISGPTSGGAAVDPNLGLLVGNDIYPDLIVGRFSGNTPEHITTQVEKTITYEQNPPAGDWFSKGLGIGSHEGAGQGDDGESDYEHMGVIKNNKLLPFTYTEVAEAYMSPPVSAVSGPVDDGLSIINYVGHGSKTSWVTSGFSNTNVNALTNGDKMPFIITVACVNGDFQTGGDCFAEAWMKKSGGGAVGIYASTINQSWAPPMKGQDYMNDLLIGGYDYDANPGNGMNVDVQKTSYGAICFNGSILMAMEDPSGGPSMLETWIIFGDASLQVRTDVPETLTLSNEAVLSGIDFTTTITAGGSAVEGALVSLYQDGEAFTGISDADGNVSIAHDLLPGNCTMTVTAFNAETIYNEECDVVPPGGPYVVVSEYSHLAGNDEEIYPGETVTISFTASNVGADPATSLNFSAIDNDDYITLIDSEVTLESLGSEEEHTFEGAFSFEVSMEVPDGHSIQLPIAISGSEDNWDGLMIFEAMAPVIISYSAEEITSYLQPDQTGSRAFEINNQFAGAEDVEYSLMLIEPLTRDLTGSYVECDATEFNPGEDVTWTFTVHCSSPDNEWVEELFLDFPEGITVNSATALSGGSGGDIPFTGFDANTATWSGSGYMADGQTATTTVELSIAPTVFQDIELDWTLHGDEWGSAPHTIEGTIDITSLGIPIEWAELDIDEGVVEGGETDVITINFDTTGMEMGEYTAQLIINDNRSRIETIIPVTLVVGGVNAEENSSSLETKLVGNYPNPFNPTTTISFDLANSGAVSIDVYNTKGQLVKTLADETYSAGTHSVVWNGRDANNKQAASGIYFYKFQAGSVSSMKKMIMIK
ncbi:MAG: C25 family cysteine peptidase [Candidatus Cloacimonadales bacterium]